MRGSAPRRKWTKKDIARLLSARKRGKTYDQCAVLLRCSRRTICIKLIEVGATKPSSLRDTYRAETRWIAREDRVIRAMYPTHSAILIAERLRRTLAAVCTRIQVLGLKKNPPKWSYDDIVRLLQSENPLDSCYNVKRTREAVYNIKYRLSRMFLLGRLDAFIRTRPNAPSKGCVRFRSICPPGLRRNSARLTRAAKNKRFEEYIAREAARARRDAATMKWRAQGSK